MSGSRVAPFGFQSSYTDSTGLIYLINRYYDSGTDQFISVDPKVATTDQPYAFTNDDPLNSADPLGLYRYTDRETIGSTKSVGSAAKVMAYFKTHLKDVFPFPVDGNSTIKNGESLVLHAGHSWDGGVGTVKVSDVTSTSFKFTVTSNNYFDPRGSTITFSTGQSGGNIYLQQKANAPGGNPLAPPIAEITWEGQAQKLSNGVGGSYICYTSIWDEIAGTVGAC